MRRRALSIGIILAVFVSAPVARAQDAQRPRITVVVKSPPSAPQTPGEPSLRQPLRASTAAAARSGQTPALRPMAPVAAAQSDIKGGITPLKGLNGPSASAMAAQCRAQCAEARYICTAQDAGDCDAVWGQCVVRCSGANYAETPDLATSAGARPRP